MTRDRSIGIDPGAAAHPVNIGLLWHSASSGNLGVGALTLGNMAIVRAVAQELGLVPRFTLLSMRDGETGSITDQSVRIRTIDSRTMLSPGGFWRWVGDLDCVLDIGAGDSFAEIYGLKRFMFLWLSKWLTIRQGTPLLLSPQTIGPFTRTPYKQLAASVMRKATAVVSRDDMSLSVAQQMAPEANNLLSVDVAFVLPFESQVALRGGEKLRMGINVSGLLFHEAESGRNRFDLSYDYAAMTRQLITTLLGRKDIEVHLVPHATNKAMPDDDDGRCADRLAKEFPGVIRVPDFAGPSEAKSCISGLDFLVAGRMHACIAAYSAGTPVVPVAYSRKFGGLFGMLGYDWMVPTTGMSSQEAVDFVVGALDQRQQLVADIAGGMTQVERKLDVYRAALRQLFSEIGNRPS